MNDKNPRPEPGPEEYAKCSILVAKAIILQNHKYTQDEIDLADFLLGFQWNGNVTDFLEVVAGIAHPGLEVEEAHAALVYPLKQQ
jgi:hypothetical protein